MPDQIHYDTLDVEYDANVSEIKNARMALIVEWHPDTNQSPVAEDKIKEINNAYDIIGNIKKRQEYDQEISHIILKRRQNRDRQEQAKQEPTKKNDNKRVTKDKKDPMEEAMEVAMRSCENIERESREWSNGFSNNRRQERKSKRQENKYNIKEEDKKEQRQKKSYKKENITYVTGEEFLKNKRNKKTSIKWSEDKKGNFIGCVVWQAAYLLSTTIFLQSSGFSSLIFTLPFFGILSIVGWHNFLRGNY